jgi:predicted lipid carrier protein YhbT
MEAQTLNNPPLSPVLLAGIAISPLPPVLLQPLLDAAMAIMNRRHPELFDRLAGLESSSFWIDPVDLPFDFLLRPASSRSLMALAAGALHEEPTAAIHGPLLTLVQLLEGKLDGDALFFSRDLIVEGDMEAVVTLRNAIDGAGIDLLEDLLSVFGPLAGPPRFIVGRAAAVFARMESDLAILSRALLAPNAERYEAQAAELKELREAVVDVRRQSGASARARRPHPAGRKAR